MLPHGVCLRKEDDGIRLFYDVWEGKMHKLHLPEVIQKRCCASYNGWMLVAAPEGTDVFLLNPLTRARIQLPPFTPTVRYLGDDWNAPRHNTPYLGGLCYSIKVMLSADLTSPECLITVSLTRCALFCCKVGDPCWTRVNNPVEIDPGDVTYHNGRFYLLYVESIVIIDSNNPNEWFVYNFEPELRAFGSHLGSFLEGKYGVYMICDYLSGGKVELYQFQEQLLKLERVTDKSNITIFNVFGSHYLTVCSGDWDSLSGKSEYRVSWKAERVRKHEVRYQYRIFSVKLNEKEELVCYLHDVARDLAPEPLMWFQPNFV
ncbi:hypothetical protein LUZ61_000838 [Rhynchospora tenuis]|uniref:KIB1-4 beta-propeller domain-containing protein n=1 Tax=Rhynchospora tenuis TaxID=198213 RepID=A0AAD5ZG40_9POAL|nr:hypothetical protein LUZ61_000838 [Rhynchospora tenuis]